MSNDNALAPIDQRTVDFYGDPITAVLVQVDEQDQVFVPIRPICDFLGVTWSPQRRRIMRDPVLARKATSVTVTVTEGYTESYRREMLCLPLDYLNGYLFGINADRVKPEIRDRVIRYQEECYRALADAFLARTDTAVSPATTELAQIRDMALAVARMAEQQLAIENRVSTAENRLDRAAAVVGELGRRVRRLEQRVSPGQPVTDEQAAEIAQQVKALAGLLAEHDPGKNHYQSVFNELYRRFGVTSYKLVPQERYAAVLDFLDAWMK